jgi:AcrR family transcriptional regulator
VGAATRARRGRPATASREDVLSLARKLFLEGGRLDLTIVSRRLGVGRATLYRWYGSRDGLLGEVLASELEGLLAYHRRRVRRHGAQGLLEVLDRTNRGLSESVPLRRLLEQERHGALRLLTSSAGPVQPRVVRAIKAMMDDEVRAGAFKPPADTDALAYATVRLGEAFLYNDATIGIRGDHERLLQVEAALLGIPISSPRAAVRGRNASRRAPG